MAELKVKETISDEKINTEGFEKSKKIISGERVEYTPSRVYELLFPNGIQLYFNRVIINLVFDGRTYKFTRPIIKFIETKLNDLAALEAKKKKQFNNPVFGSIQD
jgi:hypothetical protein